MFSKDGRTSKRKKQGGTWVVSRPRSSLTSKGEMGANPRKNAKVREGAVQKETGEGKIHKVMGGKRDGFNRLRKHSLIFTGGRKTKRKYE